MHAHRTKRLLFHNDHLALRKQGFTVVEVVISSLILAIIVLSVLSSLSYARRSLSFAENRLACMHIAREAMEELRTQGYSSAALNLGTEKTIPGFSRGRGYYNVVAGSGGGKTKDIVVVVEWMEPTGAEHSVSLTSTLCEALHK